MKITIVAVGVKQPDWATSAVKDYLARFPKDFTVTVKEVKAEPRAGQASEKLMAAEATRIKKAIPTGALIVALDEHGKDLTTMDFAQKINLWKNEGLEVAFLIGGPDGLDATLKKESRFMMRISSMTLPHAFARVLLTEQIYRAWSILNNHPYHRV